jgi:hypothetical protein
LVLLHEKAFDVSAPEQISLDLGGNVRVDRPIQLRDPFLVDGDVLFDDFGDFDVWWRGGSRIVLLLATADGEEKAADQQG